MLKFCSGNSLISTVAKNISHAGYFDGGLATWSKIALLLWYFAELLCTLTKQEIEYQVHVPNQEITCKALWWEQVYCQLGHSMSTKIQYTAKQILWFGTILRFWKTLKNLQIIEKKSENGKIFFCYFPIAFLVWCSNLWLLCSKYLKEKDKNHKKQKINNKPRKNPTNRSSEEK